MCSKVAVIVLNWNGKEDTIKCLQSLQKLSYKDLEIIVVDNGSTDGSQEALKTLFPKYTLIESGENLGYAGGNNVGIVYALKRPIEYLFILNNDTVVDPAIIEAFLEGFKQFPSVGILGSKIYLMNEPNRFDHFGGRWNAKRLDFEYVGYRQVDDKKSWEIAIHLDYVCGAGIMVHRSVFETIGLFESRFFLFCEETDFCFRAKRAGFDVMSCPKAVLWHKVSASFTGGKAHSTYFYWRNRLLWIERNFNGPIRLLYLSKLIGKNLSIFYVSRLYCQLTSLILRRGNNEKINRYNAALFGIKDYIMRRFGPGRSKNFMNCH
ncbi:MAG: glycosyltransferase family 2 protein [Verrucomicrobia bacterium]|nr:glycosyltransferase family 2 protein [Verrucomicrobiota bacterium]